MRDRDAALDQAIESPAVESSHLFRPFSRFSLRGKEPDSIIQR
jgi:hypothetical protein